jgi:hypothetical protein
MINAVSLDFTFFNIKDNFHWAALSYMVGFIIMGDRI